MDIKEIQEAFYRVSGEDIMLKKLFDNLVSVESGKGALLDYQAGGGKATLRKDHPVAALYERSQASGKVYFLLSALVSVFNRAEAMYEDRHEREFHARLIDHLLHTT